MVDRYTKSVLTVIAAALVAIAAEHAVDPSRAAPEDIQKVQICDDLGHCAAMTPHMEFQRVPAGGMSWVLPVAVEEIPSK